MIAGGAAHPVKPCSDAVSNPLILLDSRMNKMCELDGVICCTKNPEDKVF